MILNFIGQGIESDDNESIGDYICTSLKDSRFNNCKIISAFASQSGLKILDPFLKTAQREGRMVKFFIGVDDKGTSKEALEFLFKNHYESYIFHTCSNFIFHPKLYLFQGDHNRIIIGSANLTKYGLFHNIEAALLIDFTNEDAAGKKILKQITDSYKYLFEDSDENLILLDEDLINVLLEENLIYKESGIRIDDPKKIKKNETIIELFPERSNNKLELSELGSIEIKESKHYIRSAFRFKITEEYLRKWDEMFRRMILFKEKHSSVIVPRDFVDRTLYGWFRKQKVLYKSNLIPEEHKIKLDSIGFYWEDGHALYWNKKWESRFTELLALKGRPDFPNIKRHKEKNDTLYALSSWVAEQRMKYRKKLLTDDQIQRLESIGFKWNMKPELLKGLKQDDNWFEYLLKLKDYKQIHGDCNVSQINKIPDLKKLGKWLNDQRTLRKQNRLDNYRIDLLDEVGIVWDMDVHNFEIFISELLNYQNKKGNFDVPLNYPENSTLGYYIYRIKTKGLKESWKIERLKQIGFHDIGVQKRIQKSGHITKVWHDNYKKLESFTLKGINPNLPNIRIQDQALADWINNQKKNFRLGKLKQSQINDLLRIGVELSKENSLERFWTDMYEYYQLYIKEYGTMKVSRKLDPSLGYWITNQRTAKKLGLLSAEKLDKLNSIGFIW